MRSVMIMQPGDLTSSLYFSQEWPAIEHFTQEASIQLNQGSRQSYAMPMPFPQAPQAGNQDMLIETFSLKYNQEPLNSMPP